MLLHQAKNISRPKFVSTNLCCYPLNAIFSEIEEIQTGNIFRNGVKGIMKVSPPFLGQAGIPGSSGVAPNWGSHWQNKGHVSSNLIGWAI